MNDWNLTLYELEQKLARMREQGATDTTEIAIRIHSADKAVRTANAFNVKILRGSSCSGRSKIDIEGRDYSWTV